MQVNTLADLVSHIHQQPAKQNFLNYLKHGSWVEYSSKKFCNRIYNLALNLKKLGVKKGDKVAIFANSSPNWLICDLSCQLLGAVTVPMFTNISKDNLEFQLNDAKPKYAFVIGGQQWQTIKNYSHQFTYIFTHELKVKNNNTVMLSKIFEKADGENNKLDFSKFLNVKADNLATIIYTSGSTGMPKGVCLAHKNLVSQILNIEKLFRFTSKDTALSYLPLAHIFERVVGYFYLYKNVTIYFADDPNNVAELMKEIKPTLMTTVPRLLEKIHAKILLAIEEAPAAKKYIAKFALFYALHMNNKFKKICPLHNFFKKTIYRKFLKILGSRIRIMISGGAALPKETNEFFSNIGLRLYQGYGLTEASPVIAANCPRANKRGSSGKIFPSVEVKFSEQGEILAKGPNIMQGYLNNEKATKEAIENNWLKTGDLGYLDPNGYLYITGRIKDLQKTSNGKYVSSGPIEAKLKQIKYIDNALIIADNRKFTSAILFPDFASLAEKHISSQQLQQIIDEALIKINKSLNHWEQIQKHIIADKAPTIDNHQLTPSLKLRPHITLEAYKTQINKLYK